MKEKIQAFLSAVIADLKDTWNRSKIFLLALLGIIVALEFRKLQEFLLVYMGQKEIKSDKKEDQALASKENAANTEANALIDKANKESEQQPPIDDDWYKKK